MIKLVAAFSLLLLGAACAYDGAALRPGGSTESDVRQAMGAPALEFRDADGSRKLIYPRGPMGVETFVIDIGPDGQLRSRDQVLDEGHFNQIRPGMTRDEVLRMIGPPGETMRFPLSGNVGEDYRYRDTWGYLAIFSVTYDASGIVVSKFTRRLNEGRDRGR